MPSDINGVYTLPAGYLVANGDTLAPSQHNPPLEDIEDALTDRLMRSGVAAMTGPLLLADGAAETPAVAFASAPSVGFYKSGDGMAAAGLLGLPPVGVVVDYAGGSAPAGWLFCYGQSLLRADYPDLFTAIGDTYGAADGTHFNVPDCRDLVVVGKGNMGGSARGFFASTGYDSGVLGGAFGDTRRTLLTTNLPAYTPQGTNSKPAITVNIDGTKITGSASWQGGGAAQVPSAWGAATSSASLDNAPVFTGTAQGGLSTPFNNIQPSIVLNKIIFAGV